ncbi:MAG: Sjogren's syndrome/scleroderma autoantigen 1 family protein [Candidatus Hodarchaeota archaeon]
MRIKEDAKIMADLLRSGHTMLSDACPICNNPIFKDKQGNTFCPICNRKIVFVQNEQASHTKAKKSIPQESDVSLINQNNENKVALVKKHVIENITEKIHWIIRKLREESQIEMIERYTNLLLTFYEILEKFNKLEL